MTSDRNINEDEEKLRSAAMNGHWYLVLDMYKKKRELRMAKITKGDTVLHMAVESSGREHVVDSMVGIVCGEKTDEQDETSTSLPSVDENGNEKKLILRAQNGQGNTPLHLAASIGNVRMCKKIGGIDSSLIAERNHAGETPLFLAAFHGHRKAFLCLHYLYMNSSQGSSTHNMNSSQGSSTHNALYKIDNNDTILHYAMAGGHIDVAIEIILLYKNHLKEMTMMRNKNGLTPLHILAITPLAFESTDLPSRSYVVQLLYHWFFRVKKKEQPTTSDELKELEELEREPCIRSCIESLKDLFEVYRFGTYFSPGPYWVAKIRRLILYSLDYLSRILLFPLSSLEYLFTAAGKWFHGIRNMKEKHTWSLQIMEQLLSFDSCKLLFGNPYEEESDKQIYLHSKC